MNVSVLTAVFGILALAAWMSAVVHSLILLRHTAPPRKPWSLLYQGWRFFHRDTFTPEAGAIHRRFILSAAAFALVIFAGVVVGALVAWS